MTPSSPTQVIEFLCLATTFVELICVSTSACFRVSSALRPSDVSIAVTVCSFKCEVRSVFSSDPLARRAGGDIVAPGKACCALTALTEEQLSTRAQIASQFSLRSGSGSSNEIKPSFSALATF